MKHIAKNRFPIIAVNIVTIILIYIFSATTIVPVRENRFDFYPRWVGGRALWNGQSPYEDEVTERIQVGMFGSVLPESSDQQRFAYPAYTGLVIAPLLVFPSQTAIAIWLALQLWALLVTASIWLIILRWQPSLRSFFALILGLVFVFRYPMILFVVGQFTGTMLLLISLGIYLLLRGQDAWAGVMFALSTVPPTISAPLALIILGSYAIMGRWRGLVTFAVTLAILTGITFAFVGWWIPDFLNQLSDYSRYAFPVWAPGIFESPLVSLLVVSMTVLWLLWSIRDLARHHDKEHQIQFTLSAAIAALILFPQTGNYYLVLLIPPILVVVRRVQEMRGNWQRIIGGLIVLAIVSPWLYFLVQDQIRDAAALFLPLHVGILLILSFRHQDGSPRVDRGETYSIQARQG